MRNIERLPESVHSSVRSGAVIRDLTAIVEELVFNSLDAGATKVSVAVGVGSCYVKVVDNGSGITRDGLLLLGEQYATSKFDHMAVMDTGVESLDFHGEALCSISNASLLEIVTKVHGKPNGYRKIIKNSKCLFLGINDDRQGVGTTVIVRDIFYNQPVRRKHMESSPKKVLDSIKMSVLRIALVHFHVPFIVVDVESGDELLHTGHSSSLLSILSRNFGIEDSVSFHRVDSSDGELKLSGFISGPHEKFNPKTIQYTYINSRFICKGPIHKLLNQLAVKFDFPCSWLPDTSSEHGMEHKQDKCPIFVLNLCCPRIYYDMINSEQSRRSVEFKDWGPVLTFIENAIMRLWAKNVSHDMPDSSRRRKKRCSEQICQSLSQQKNICKDYNDMPASEEYISSSRRVSKLRKSCTEAGYPSDSPSQLYDRSLGDYKVTFSNDNWRNPSYGNVFSSEYVSSAYVAKEDDPSSSALGNILLPFDANIDDIPIATGTSDRVRLDNEIYVGKGKSKSLLRNCSSERILPRCRRSPSIGEDFIFESDDDIQIPRRWVDSDNSMLDEISLATCINEPFKLSSMNHYKKYEMSEFPSSSEQVSKGTSILQSSRFECSPVPAHEVLGISFLDGDGDPMFKTSVEDSCEFGTGSVVRYSAKAEDEDLRYLKLNTEDSWQQQSCSVMHFPSDKMRGLSEFQCGGATNVFSSQPSKRSSEIAWSCLPSHLEVSPKNYSVRLSYEIPTRDHECGRADIRDRKISKRKNCSVRSHSAPPCYKGKKRYMALPDSFTILSAKCNFQNLHAGLSSNEPSNSNLATPNFKCSQKSLNQCLLSPEGRPFMAERQDVGLTPEIVANKNSTPRMRDQLVNIESPPRISLDMNEIEGSFDSGSKWRNCCLSIAGGDIPNYKNQDSILDISSDIFDIAGDSLVPKSIGRMILEGAKVLNQVDKKFIPVVAGKTLAIIDQHAADERIRLEELRHKVLSGEMKTITYLDAEQELVLPEIGYQLLHNYAEQIQTWGWICNIHSQDTSSFAKRLEYLHRQPTVVKLLAVPCILGVKLTDTDLLEFLQQLADTDGSSTIPPSVHRILNNKACRGAIMFGDALLPSECSLIVKELRQTSLCFQCAHGRPTTVPLVDLDLLHSKITKDGSNREPWHGFCQHKLSLERSRQRLKSALCQRG